ncbi:hypothetical protein QQS21_003287 [Conoideocrella luteorostrata]|uniref:Uncharacterized protein n=1 Tax=Conoideocrella luteorostrata TaxID=1105319 RepID=A0AAJ0CTE2_9HYPO|nr:hypothetical protein QQS21_003287 [Conoideocrella luteorostrata]
MVYLFLCFAHVSCLTFEEEIKWTLVHCYFANMGGFVHYRGKNSFPVTAQQLAESPLFDSPAVSVEDIEDKSKQDWLAKIFAALQILQLILSIITRHIQGLQFSQLETVTLSFAICGLVIYYTYFHKPQNIGRPVELQNYMLLSDNASQNGATGAQATLADEEIQRKSASLQKTTPQLSLQFQQTYDSFWAIILNQHSRPGKTGGPSYPKRIPNDNIPIYEGSNDVHPAVYLLALASGLFGAIHAIAWYFEFPTDVEKLLWQIATGISAASPVVGLLAIPLAQLTKSAGTHELFMGNCLRLMQEYYWQFRNNTSVRHAINELEYAFATGQRKSYAAIFPAAETGDNKLLLDLRDFLHLQGDSNGLDTKPFELHDDKLFIRNFHRLVSALNGTETKKIQEAAWTDTWPRKSVFPREINQALLYITGILYCASRLLLLGISLSSVRKMPGSVYIQANWTQYLPAFGASSG